MARIRTIKPEFWTDGKIVQLPYEVRLLFIGLWNFCDDEGYLDDEPERIGLQILPSDPVDVESCIDLLVACELLERLEGKDGSRYLRIKHFEDHQKISHPTRSKIAPKVSGKLSIPQESRRRVAIKYGCTPGGQSEASCYSCGATGSIWWPKTQKGKPSGWVAFSGIEISHFQPESKGGKNTEENLVLCCRRCNRSMATNDPVSYIVEKKLDTSVSHPESSGGLPRERKGKEDNGKERKGEESENTLSFSSHGKDSDFQNAWRSWIAKQSSKSGRIDQWTQQGQLKELERFSTEEAIAVVEYSTSRTNCVNLITNGDHRKATNNSKSTFAELGL